MEAARDLVPIRVAISSHEKTLNCAWSSKNQLAVHGAALGCTGHSNKSTEGTPPCLNFIQWNVDMYDSIMRRLANESLNVFVTLQKDVDGKADQQRVLHSSLEYRAIITACTQELQSTRDVETLEPEQAARCDELLKSLYISELVWSLCEILLIEQPAGGLLVSRLMAWTRVHLSEWRSAVDETLRLCDDDRLARGGGEIHWSAIYGCVLRGQFDEARKLLALLPDALSAPHAIADELLRRMPVFESRGGHSVTEFSMRWRHWQQECRRRLNDGEFSADENLSVLCRILCGDDSVFSELGDVCETWYGMLVSRLIFQYPAAKLHELPAHAQFCIDCYGGYDCFEVHDSMLLAAIEMNVLQVVKLCTEHFSNTWYVAHFVDLMQHSDLLNSKTVHFGLSLRAHLVLEYGACLLQHDSLWNVGAIYLDYCGKRGRCLQKELLPHISLTNEKKARKLISACRQRGLTDEAASICKVMAVKAVATGQLSSALAWCHEGKDSAYATVVAERFLDQYEVSGMLDENLDILESLGSALLLSKRVLFLAKYHEFHQLHEQAKFKEAGVLLLSLLTSNVTPRRYWLMLLTDALPLLESSEGVFSTSQTYDLMACLEDLADTSAGNSVDAKMVDEKEVDHLELLKLGLARNLARAIVDEATNDCL